MMKSSVPQRCTDPVRSRFCVVAAIILATTAACNRAPNPVGVPNPEVDRKPDRGISTQRDFPKNLQDNDQTPAEEHDQRHDGFDRHGVFLMPQNLIPILPPSDPKLVNGLSRSFSVRDGAIALPSTGAVQGHGNANIQFFNIPFGEQNTTTDLSALITFQFTEVSNVSGVMLSTGHNNGQTGFVLSQVNDEIHFYHMDNARDDIAGGKFTGCQTNEWYDLFVKIDTSLSDGTHPEGKIVAYLRRRNTESTLTDTGVVYAVGAALGPLGQIATDPPQAVGTGTRNAAYEQINLLARNSANKFSGLLGQCTLWDGYAVSDAELATLTADDGRLNPSQTFALGGSVASARVLDVDFQDPYPIGSISDTYTNAVGADGSPQTLGDGVYPNTLAGAEAKLTLADDAGGATLDSFKLLPTLGDVPETRLEFTEGAVARMRTTISEMDGTNWSIVIAFGFRISKTFAGGTIPDSDIVLFEIGADDGSQMHIVGTFRAATGLVDVTVKPPGEALVTLQGTTSYSLLHKSALAISRDGDTVKLIANGVEDSATLDSTSTVGTGTERIYLGGDASATPTGHDHHFDGLHIWSTTLTDAQLEGLVAHQSIIVAQWSDVVVEARTNEEGVTQAPAGAMVMVDASGIPGTQPYPDQHMQLWDFGSGSIFDPHTYWNHTIPDGEVKGIRYDERRPTGMLAGRCYEEAGTYPIHLQVTSAGDNAALKYEGKITDVSFVSDSTVNWTKIYIDPVDGDDGNDGSTPALAIQTDDQAETLARLPAENVMVLVKAGSTLTSDDTISGDWPKLTVWTVYGGTDHATLKQPRVSSVGVGTFKNRLAFTGADDFRWSHIDIEGNGGPNRMGGYSEGGPGEKRVLMTHMEVRYSDNSNTGQVDQLGFYKCRWYRNGFYNSGFHGDLSYAAWVGCDFTELYPYNKQDTYRTFTPQRVVFNRTGGLTNPNTNTAYTSGQAILRLYLENAGDAAIVDHTDLTRDFARARLAFVELDQSLYPAALDPSQLDPGADNDTDPGWAFYNVIAHDPTNNFIDVELNFTNLAGWQTLKSYASVPEIDELTIAGGGSTYSGTAKVKNKRGEHNFRSMSYIQMVAAGCLSREAVGGLSHITWRMFDERPTGYGVLTDCYTDASSFNSFSHVTGGDFEGLSHSRAQVERIVTFGSFPLSDPKSVTIRDTIGGDMESKFDFTIIPGLADGSGVSPYKDRIEIERIVEHDNYAAANNLSVTPLVVNWRRFRSAATHDSNPFFKSNGLPGSSFANDVDLSQDNPSPGQTGTLAAPTITLESLDSDASSLRGPLTAATLPIGDTPYTITYWERKQAGADDSTREPIGGINQPWVYDTDTGYQYRLAAEDDTQTLHSSWISRDGTTAPSQPPPTQASDPTQQPGTIQTPRIIPSSSAPVPWTRPTGHVIRLPNKEKSRRGAYPFRSR